VRAPRRTGARTAPPRRGRVLRNGLATASGRGNDVGVSTPAGSTAPKSLPLILARELASNLATPMFLIDANGVLAYYNDAAAILLGRSWGELGEIPAEEFGAALELATPDGARMSRLDSPSAVALLKRRPAHASVLATSYNGVRRGYEVTAYPLFGATGDMHGVITVFWEEDPKGHD